MLSEDLALISCIQLNSCYNKEITILCKASRNLRSMFVVLRTIIMVLLFTICSRAVLSSHIHSPYKLASRQVSHKSRKSLRFGGSVLLHSWASFHEHDRASAAAVAKDAFVEPPSLAALENVNGNSTSLDINSLRQKYGGKFICINLPQYPTCDIYLCGTLHVSRSSVQMVQDVIRGIRPNAVIIELCSNRIDSLIVEENQSETPISMKDVLKAAWKDKSMMTLGTGMLVWMQGKAASLLGSKLGGELSTAAKEAHAVGAVIVLGDRLYDVTIQRIFDRLSTFEKLKAGVIMIWEVVTMSIGKMKDYIAKSQDEEEFVQDEIEKFAEYFPALADVIIRERDEYLAQSILEVVKFSSVQEVNMAATDAQIYGSRRRRCIVAVVGAGHLAGICSHLEKGGSPLSRIQEISKSSKHEISWPPSGYFSSVDSKALYGNKA